MSQFARQSPEDINLDDLNVNQAFLNITSRQPDKLWMYTLSADCIRCPFTRSREIEGWNQYLIKFDASRSLEWKFFKEDQGQYASDYVTPFCEINPTGIGPKGVYNVDIRAAQCDFGITLSYVSYNLAFLYALLILAGVIIFVYGGNYVYRRFKRTRQSTEVNSEVKPEQLKPSKIRLRSLDAFRGIAIVLMIFVNSGGGAVWWIEHATWNGLYIADLVFPWFIWIMGVCIPMSIKSQVSRNTSGAKILWTIFVRSVKLFFIGFCLNTRSAAFENVRIMGVLQRFGISYFVVASIHVILYIHPKDVLPNGKLKRAIYDIYILAHQWFVILCLAAMHVVITFTLIVPECPKGYLGPGGKQDNALYMNCIGGATAYLDEKILGSKHIYQWPTAGSVYNASAFDPEGMVGCLNTFLHVFIGLQCGVTFMVYTEWKQRIIRFLIWGAALGIIGGALCYFSQEGGVIPVNKNLWSLSFVFATSALAYLLLTFFYLMIDVLKWWSGTPFVYAGMNAILLYVGHSIVGSMFPFRWRIGLMNTHLVLLVENMWHAGVWVVISYYFYCKKVFVSV